MEVRSGRVPNPAQDSRRVLLLSAALMLPAPLLAQVVIDGRLEAEDEFALERPLGGVRVFASLPGGARETLAFRTWEAEPAGWFRLSGPEGLYTLVLCGPGHFARPIVITNLYTRDGERIDLAPRPRFDLAAFEDGFWDSSPARGYFQVFAPRGRSITHVGFKLATDGIDGGGPLAQDVLISIHRAGSEPPEEWEQVGPAATVRDVDCGGPKGYWYAAAWSSGEVPVEPGRSYAVYLRPADPTRRIQAFWRPEVPRVRYATAFGTQALYRLGASDGAFVPERLWMAVGSDGDGLLIPYAKRVRKEFCALTVFARKWSQTYVARGRGLASVILYAATSGVQPPMSRQRLRVLVRRGGPEGPPVGESKLAAGSGDYTGDASWGTFGAAFAPGEVPLVPGETYAVEFETVETEETIGGFINIKGERSDGCPGFNPYRKCPPDDYAGGTAYLLGREPAEFDLDMEIVEYENAARYWSDATERAEPLAAAGWNPFTIAGRLEPAEPLRVAGEGAFDGGFVRRVEGLSPHESYRLACRARATWALSDAHACLFGIDPTGQTEEPAASTIAWESFAGIHGFDGTHRSRPVRPRASTLSLWLRARSSGAPEKFPFAVRFSRPALERALTSAPLSWRDAWRRSPPSAGETRAFMLRLARFVEAMHLKRDEGSSQRGMVYEYRNMRARDGEPPFVQGEALDTMHDGAWFGAAMVHAYRATGEERYLRILTGWQLPFYLRMLNESDRLFSGAARYARPDRIAVWDRSRMWLFQEGEMGFVPYWWDDGASVSLERRPEDPLPPYPCFDAFLHEGRENPELRVHGYSLGSSNHLAQDLAVFLELSWLLFREASIDADRELARRISEAARNLHLSRVRHHGPIPMCVAAAALATGDAELMGRVPDPEGPLEPRGDYVDALAGGKRVAMPGFADDQEYRYYHGLAKTSGTLPEALAFRTIYDAITLPLLYRYYSDDAPVPPGIHRFDLHPYWFEGGKPADYRSDRKGPFGGPRPIGSRLGPQNMVVAGWALQALRAHPGIWEARYSRRFASDLRVRIIDGAVREIEDEDKTALELGGAALSVWSTHTAFWLEGSTRQDELELSIWSGPDASGRRARVALRRGAPIVAVSDAGKALEVRKAVLASGGEGEGLRFFSFGLPYTAVKGQGEWMTAVEHSRATLEVGGERRNIYLASSEDDVRRALERELGGGLRTWEAVFEEWGYIPTGIGAGSAGSRYQWEHFSDSGAYAHLISAGAQWLLYLDGRSDWVSHRFPQPSPETRRGTVATIPPEDPGAREGRKARVAERRAGMPVLVHRGATRFAPENTLEAMVAALERGADGVEIDIRRSRDGILYLFHDDLLDRMTDCCSAVAEKTYTELLACRLEGTAGFEEPPCIPTLAAMLALARDRAMLLHLDVKEPGLEEGIERLIEEAGIWEHIVEVNAGNAERLRNHPKVARLAYKGWFPEGDAPDTDEIERFLERRGSMVFTKGDPAPALRALGRDVSELPGRPEVPRELRKEWRVRDGG